MVPFRNSVRSAGAVSVSAWFFHFQNFFIGIFLLSVIANFGICKSPGVSKREHIAIDQVQVSALLSRDAVHVLQFPDVVGAHPAVLPCRSIAVHAACVVAAKQTLHIELGKILFLFLCGKERPLDGLLPAHQPGLQRVFHELQRLLLNIRKARLLQVAHHVGRHPENSSNLIDLKFSGFQKLCLFRRDANRRIFHSFL